MYSVWPAERLVAFFRQHNACAGPAEKSVLSGQNPQKVEVERSTRCSGGRVEYYRIVDGGHNARPQAPSASQLFVDFFRDQPAAVAAATPATPAQPSAAGGAAAPAVRPAPAPTPSSDYESSFERALADFRRTQPAAGGASPLPPPAARPTPVPPPGSDYESSFERALADFRRTQPAAGGASPLPPPASRPAPAPTAGSDYESSFERALADFRKAQPPAADAPPPRRPPVAAPVPAAPTVAALPPATAASTPQARAALVIGNGDYRHAARLANPANDATDIAQALRKLGFDVTEGRDLDKRGMEDKLREFGRKLDKADLALFFYAGHGMQVGGKNYLIPVDAKLERQGDLNLDTVDVASVLAQMEAERRVNLVFLDACRDNPLARSFARSLGARSSSVGHGLSTIQSAIGTMIAYATQPDNVALDGDGQRNSPFTTALLKHLATPGLDIGALMRRVRADVIAATREKQVPWDHSSLIGEVILAR